MTRIKICGNRTADDVLAAAEAGADFVGMIFAHSPRRIDAEQGRAMVDALAGRPGAPPGDAVGNPSAGPGPAPRSDLRGWFEHGAELLTTRLDRRRPLTVGVFADQPIDEVNALAAEAAVDLVQLSGDESWQDCLLVERPVIQVVHVSPIDSPSDPMASVEPGFAILLMLDAAHGPYRGGGGRTFDWEVAAEVSSRIPMLLAGGLNPDNVREAITRVHPWAVDVSSGTERDGRKDHALVRDFIEAVRAADGVDSSFAPQRGSGA